MKRLSLVGALVALAAGAAIAAASVSAQGAPEPSAGEVLVSGLIQPKGIIMGPDGMLYVAESGNGGTTDFEIDGTVMKNGFTGRISKVDPETGARTTVADGLPSNASPDGEAVGPTDVAFIGNKLYYLQTHAGADWGFPDWSTGIYSVQDDGDVDLIADLGEFNKDNPTDAITSGVQQDIEIGGNPYAMIVRNSVFYVTDGNHNHLLRVGTGGSISEIVEFPNHPVSTGIASTASGPFYVAYLGQGPFLPADGKVVTVGTGGGAITTIASGAAMLTDVQVHNGTVYALQFNDPEEAGEAFFAPGTAKIFKANADGTMSPVVTGLSFATFFEFDGDTAYVSNFGIAEGQIIKIEDFSAIQPAAATPTAAATQPAGSPVPTATPRPGVTAPDTGNGGYIGQDGGTSAWTMLAGAALVVALAGGAFALKRR